MNLAKKREIAARIRERLEDLGHNNVWLAKELGVSKTMAGKYVSEDDPVIPGKGTPRFAQIAGVIEVSKEWLWSGEEQPQSRGNFDLMAASMKLVQEEASALGLTLTYDEWIHLAKVVYEAAVDAGKMNPRMVRIGLELLNTRPPSSSLPKDH